MNLNLSKPNCPNLMYFCSYLDGTCELEPEISSLDDGSFIVLHRKSISGEGSRYSWVRCKGTKCAIPDSSALNYKTWETIHPSQDIYPYSDDNTRTSSAKISNLTNNRFMITYRRGADDQAYARIYTYTPYTDDDDLGTITEGSEFKIDSNSGGFAIDSVESFGDGYILTWHQGGNILMQIFN